jgi:hypothetical protein
MNSGLAICVAALVCLVVGAQTILAQATTAQSAQCFGESDSISVSGTVLEPRPLLEVELELRNKSTGKLHLDPSLFALVSDQGEKLKPLTPEQEKSLAGGPTQSGWWQSVASYFGLGWISLAMNEMQDAARRAFATTFETKNLGIVDVYPGATVKGSLFLRSFTSKTNRLTLSIHGITEESGETLAAVRLNCELPRSTTVQGQMTPDNDHR